MSGNEGNDLVKVENTNFPSRNSNQSDLSEGNTVSEAYTNNSYFRNNAFNIDQSSRYNIDANSNHNLYTRRAFFRYANYQHNINYRGSRSFNVGNTRKYYRKTSFTNNTRSSDLRNKLIRLKSLAMNMINPLVPEFNPDTSEVSSWQWLAVMELMAQQFNWSKELEKYYVISRLRGYARRWYMFFGRHITDWWQFKHEFCLAFPSTEGFRNEMEEMIKYMQDENETMEHYFLNKSIALNCCGVSGVRAVTFIIGGMRDTSLKYELFGEYFISPDDLFKYLLRNKPDIMAENQEISIQVTNNTDDNEGYILSQREVKLEYDS